MIMFSVISVLAFANDAMCAPTNIPRQDSIPAYSGPPLRFGSDGTFHLSIFEDLHYGEGEANPPSLGWGPISDTKSTGVIDSVLSAENPDFVVINGDLITGEDTYLFNSTDYLHEIVAPLVSRNIPWASTYGNHDEQYNLSTHALYVKERTEYGTLSMTKSEVSDSAAGTSNYYLPVYPSDGGSTPSLILWFFDSLGGVLFQELDSSGNTIGDMGCVHDSVVFWFQSTSVSLQSQYGSAIPSLAFVHIPVYASNAFQTQIGVDPNKNPGINDDNPCAIQGIDSNGDYTGADIPFMQALVNTENLMAVFSGHDHGDDWCFKWDMDLSVNGNAMNGNGKVFCFSRHTGYGGYGHWTRGSRQLRLTEGQFPGNVETWMRLEDGSTVSDVMLNSTFGSDAYPAVPDTDSN